MNSMERPGAARKTILRRALPISTHQMHGVTPQKGFLAVKFSKFPEGSYSLNISSVSSACKGKPGSFVTDNEVSLEGVSGHVPLHLLYSSTLH